MKQACLFGALDLDLAAAKTLIEKALGITFEAHESEYHGGDYFRASNKDFNVVLQTNFVEDDGEHTEAAFAEFPVLVFVNGERTVVDTLGSELGRAKLRLLRSESF